MLSLNPLKMPGSGRSLSSPLAHVSTFHMHTCCRQRLIPVYTSISVNSPSPSHTRSLRKYVIQSAVPLALRLEAPHAAELDFTSSLWLCLTTLWEAAASVMAGGSDVSSEASINIPLGREIHGPVVGCVCLRPLQLYGWQNHRDNSCEVVIGVAEKWPRLSPLWPYAQL